MASPNRQYERIRLINPEPTEKKTCPEITKAV